MMLKGLRVRRADFEKSMGVTLFSTYAIILWCWYNAQDLGFSNSQVGLYSIQLSLNAASLPKVWEKDSQVPIGNTQQRFRCNYLDKLTTNVPNKM